MGESLANWYEHPELYDLAFGWDPSTEVDFIEATFERFAARPVRKVFEPFVGTGRIAIELARRGYQVGGIDLASAAIEFAKRRADAAGVAIDLMAGDVRYWQADAHDAVVTLIDSFRYLLTEGDADAAIRAFSAAIEPGGILIIGIDVGEKPLEVTEEESWTMERGGTVVETSVFDLRTPGQVPGTSVVRSVLRVTDADSREHRVVTDAEMRLYTLDSFLQLVTGAGAFETMGVFDRRYNLEKPANRRLPFGDVVGVFRRTG